MKTISLGFLQIDVELGDIEANLKKVHKQLSGLSFETPCLLVLPELWATGFAYRRLPELAAKTSELLAELVTLAGRKGCWLAGSLPEAAVDGKFYNTLYVCGPEGVSGHYRKQQLFAPMEEDRYFAPGYSPRPIASGLGLLAGLVCYDLRFADLAGWLCAEGADFLVVAAQWPVARLDHWRTLLRARAIENQIYVAACNRCGRTENTDFAGHSMVIGPDGAVLAEAGEEEAATIVRVETARQEEVRSRSRTVGLRPYRHTDADKIVDAESALTRVQRNKKLGRSTVFTNGCFDILHAGHVAYLEKARALGDFLVVGLNSDASVRAIKGPERPVNSEQDRARVLAALGCVDLVVLFSDETPLQLISALLPDVLVKGADWAAEDIVGGSEVRQAGGRVVTVPLVENRSTTGLISRIRQS